MVGNWLKDQKQSHANTTFLPGTNSGANHDLYFLKIFNIKNATQRFQIEGRLGI